MNDDYRFDFDELLFISMVKLLLQILKSFPFDFNIRVITMKISRGFCSKILPENLRSCANLQNLSNTPIILTGLCDQIL